MTISSPTFQRLQDGIKSVDDLRVRGPVNAALTWLSGDLVTQLNTHFGAVSTSISAAITAFSNSNSIQIAAQIAAFPIVSGTYTPTLTNVANLDSATAQVTSYSRVGNVVTVFGRVDVDPTANGTTTQLGISLPVASNFANTWECAGTGGPQTFVETAKINADTANDRAHMEFISTDLNAHSIIFHFSYRII